MIETHSRIPLKTAIRIGTEFKESGRDCVVTRVTDLDFDTLDKDSGSVTVRSLAAWDSPSFTNRLSGVRNLLRLPPAAGIGRLWA